MMEFDDLRENTHILKCSWGCSNHVIVFQPYQHVWKDKDGNITSEEPVECTIFISSYPASLWERVKTACEVLWYGKAYRGGDVLARLDELKELVATLEPTIYD